MLPRMPFTVLSVLNAAINSGLKPRAKIVFTSLGIFAGNKLERADSVPQLGKNCGGLSDRTVRYALAELEDYGWIERPPYKGRPRHWPTVFTLKTGRDPRMTKRTKLRP